MYEWIMPGVGLVPQVGGGMLVASECALVNLDRNDLETRRARGEKRLAPTIKAANSIIKSFGSEPKEELSGARSAEELSSLGRCSALEGVLGLDHPALLHRTLRFSGHSAADVMTARVRMVTIGSDDTAEQIVSLATATGYSRFPVTGRDRDQVFGVRHVRHSFAVALDNRSGESASGLKLEPLRVPKSMGVDTLLGLLRRQGLQMAIVSDEHDCAAQEPTSTSLRNSPAGCRMPPVHKFLRPFELPDRTGRRGRIPHGS